MGLMIGIHFPMSYGAPGWPPCSFATSSHTLHKPHAPTSDWLAVKELKQKHVAFTTWLSTSSPGWA